MKFKRKHTHNGKTYAAGDRYTGPVHTGRFLYQRGALEPDGSPEDAAITAKRPLNSWSDGSEPTVALEKPKTTKASKTSKAQKEEANGQQS